VFALHSCVTFALQAQLTTHAHPQPHFWPSHPTNTEAGRCGRRRSSDLGLKDAELLEISPVVGEFEYVRTYTLTASVKSDNVSAWVRCSPSRPAVYMYSLASCATRKAHLGHEGSGQLGADGAWTTRGAVAQIPFNSVMDGSNAVNLPSPVLIGTRTGGHHAPRGMRIGGTWVPWEGTVCVTPADLHQSVLSLEGCFEEPVCNEAGCNSEQCTFQYLAVGFDETNDSIFRVNSYVNVPDALTMHSSLASSLRMRRRSPAHARQFTR